MAYGSVGLDWGDYVVSDPALRSPMETGRTVADSSKARAQLGWEANVGFEELITKMVAAQREHLMVSGVVSST